MTLPRLLAPAAALVAALGTLPACSSSSEGPGPGGMRAPPPPGIVSPGSTGVSGGRERVFDANRGASF